MNKAVFAILSFLVLTALIGRACHADDTVQESMIESEVQGAATLDLYDAVHSHDGPWVYLLVTPDVPSQNFRSLHVSGRYAVLEQLSGPNAPTFGRYYWLLSSISAASSGGMDKLTKSGPFEWQDGAKSDYVVARLNPRQSGLAYFDTVFLVPATWKPEIQPAVQFLKGQSNWSDAGRSSGVNARLKGLLSHKNPVVVVAAAQKLTAAGQFSADDMRTVIARNDTELLAAVVAVCCLNGWIGQSANVTSLLHDVDSASNLDQLTGIAAGVVAASQITANQAYNVKSRYSQNSFAVCAVENKIIGVVRTKLNQSVVASATKKSPD